MKKIILFLFIFLTGLCFGQNLALVQDLEEQLKNAQSDSDEIFVLAKLHQALYLNSPAKALEVANQSLSVSKKTGNKKFIADALTQMGDAQWVAGKNSEAVINYEEALKIYEEIKYIPGLCISYRNQGKILNNKSDFSKALEYFFKGLKLAEESGNKYEISKCNSWIGTCFKMQGLYTSALQYLTKAAEIAKSINNNEELGKNYLNIGHIMSEKGIGENQKDTLLYSVKTYNHSLELLKNSQNFILISSCYNSIGIANEELGNFEEALVNYKKALEYKIKLGDEGNIAPTYQNIGNTYKKMKDYALALEIEKKALEIDTRIGNKYNASYDYRSIAQIYELMNDFKNALFYYDSSVVIDQGMFSKQNSSQLAEMQTKYETEKKEKEIGELMNKNISLNQQNKIQNLEIKNNYYLIGGLSGAILLILVIGYLLLQQKNLAANHAKLDLEQKLLRSQMNPHFIFNAMMAIQSFIYKQDPDEASKYLFSFMKLLRSILEGSRVEYVKLDKEIEFLKNYLDLQLLRFSGKFHHTIVIDSKIDTENTFVPPMMAQPFLENAIEHGIKNLKGVEGEIVVRFAAKNEMITLEIEDNGIGREKSNEIKKLETEKHLSVATNITRERLANLNKKAKRKISMNIFDLKNEWNEPRGTKVTFNFPDNLRIHQN